MMKAVLVAMVMVPLEGEMDMAAEGAEVEALEEGEEDSGVAGEDIHDVQRRSGTFMAKKKNTMCPLTIHAQLSRT